MCQLCPRPSFGFLQRPAADRPERPAPSRRRFLAGAAAALALPALAQVDVGNASAMRKLVPAETLEQAADQQYAQLLAKARAQGALAPADNPQLLRLHAIARRLIPQTYRWNERARNWRWQVNLIFSKQLNAFCMPGGKIAVYSGIIDQLALTDDELAMILGHEMAHALREHARERVAKSKATSMGLSLGAQLLGLGSLGDLAAGLEHQEDGDEAVRTHGTILPPGTGQVLTGLAGRYRIRSRTRHGPPTRRSAARGRSRSGSRGKIRRRGRSALPRPCGPVRCRTRRSDPPRGSCSRCPGCC